jgi:hypothetical protein
MRLVAHFDVSLPGQCLVAWPDDQSLLFDCAIREFQVGIVLIPYVSCTDMAANEIRKHLEKLEQKYNAEHNRDKGRTSHLAAVAIAQGLTRGTV